MKDELKLPLPTEIPPSPFSERDQVRRPPLSGRDWVAVCFAGALMLVITGISIALFLEGRAPAPVLSGIPLESQKAAVEHYQELTTVLGERTEKIFDLIITKALLPIFATLIGFILGKRSQAE